MRSSASRALRSTGPASDAIIVSFAREGILFIVIAALVAAGAYAFALNRRSWPLWVLFDTANIEGLVAILTGVAIIAFIQRRPWLAVSLIGLAGAMKIFPLILLALFLPQRRYRELLFGIALALAVNIASLAMLGPSISEAQRNINAGLRIVTTGDALAATSPGPDTNHSLYNAVRWATLVVNYRHPHEVPPDPEAVTAILRPVYLAYLAVVALAALVLYFVRIRRLPLLNQMLALTICAVTLPPLSRDYTLLHLLVPFGLLCIYAAEHPNPTRGLRACFLCLAFIFNADVYFNLGYSLASPIRALALLALLVVTLKYPFHSAYLDEPPQPAHV